MTPTESKPKRSPREKHQSLSIFVQRERIGIVMTMRPLTEAQRSVLTSSTVKKWPKVYELRVSDELMVLLKNIGVAWTITKDAPRSTPE